MPQNILMYKKGEDPKKASLNAWQMAIPGSMFDYAALTIDVGRGVARACPQTKDTTEEDANKELDFTQFPRCMRRIKYHGTKSWYSEQVDVTYTGFWKNNRFHGSGTLQFDWNDKFAPGRQPHKVVVKLQGEFDSGDLTGDATIQYSPKSSQAQLDIKEYRGACVLEEVDGPCFWQVFKHGEGTTTLVSTSKPSKDRWEKDRKICHIG